ncbi:hypothetical protein ES704_01412 [subsurface metagenome]|jgi:hypothetical protein
MERTIISHIGYIIAVLIILLIYVPLAFASLIGRCLEAKREQDKGGNKQ